MAGTPSVQFNRHQRTSIDVAPWLESDLRLSRKASCESAFSTTVRACGCSGKDTGPLEALQDPLTRAEINITCPQRIPGANTQHGRMFLSIAERSDALQQSFRSVRLRPGGLLGAGRFDTAELPVLYGSQDLEVCLHECRVTAEDEIYLRDSGTP